MEEHHIKRFTWTKDEVRSLLLADLQSRGIEVVEGETALSLSGMTVTLEIWRASLAQEETLGQDGGESKGKSANQNTRRI